MWSTPARLTFLILLLLDVGLSSVLQHVHVLRLRLEDFAAHQDRSAALLALQRKRQWSHTHTAQSELIYLCWRRLRGLTCVSAWQMRSLARREKWCTLGSVFITASYLLTASSYLREQGGRVAVYNNTAALGRNSTMQEGMIAPANITPLCYSLTLVLWIWYPVYVKFDATPIHIQKGFAWLFVRAESQQCFRERSQMMQFLGFRGGYYCVFYTNTH